MKKSIMLYLLLFLSFTISAQEMAFDQTVKYINDKLMDASDEVYQILADKSGNVKVTHPSGKVFKFNFFDLDLTAIHYSDAEKREWGFELVSYGFVNSSRRRYQITANIDKTNTVLISHFDNQLEAERVFKAFIHLRSLCTQVKDPFDK